MLMCVRATFVDATSPKTQLTRSWCRGQRHRHTVMRCATAQKSEIMVVLSLNALGLNEKSDQGEGSHADGFSFGFRI